MSNVAQIKPDPEVTFLTHEAYAAYCTRVALETRTVPRVFVQCRRRGMTLCGRVKLLSDHQFSDGEWFKVELVGNMGDVWVPSRQVRLCSGDGACACEVSV